MGVPSTVRRSPSGARQQAGTLMSLAPCPVEDCPVGGCIPTIPTSTSHCSLRCSRNARLNFVNLRIQPVNQPLPRIASNNGPSLPLFQLFQVQNSPRLPFWELTLILVHGYDTTSGLSQSGVLVRGARGRAPLTDHDISPSNSSDSMEDRRPQSGRRREPPLEPKG